MYSIRENLLKRKVARAENFDTERARSATRPSRRSPPVEDSGRLAAEMRFRRSRIALALPLLLPLLLGAGRLHNDAIKLRAFEPPVGWEAQPANSYPRLVGVWENKDGGRLTLVAQKLARDTSARALAESSRPALERQGFRQLSLTNDGDRVRLEANLEDGRRLVRQLYAVADGFAYVVTLVGPAAKAPQLRRDFDEAAASLAVGDGGEGGTPRR
jgi:hypothetical protein